MNAHSALTRQQQQALIVSIVISVGAYLAFSIWSGWDNVRHALILVGIQGILIALAMSLINYGLRFLRWQLLLRKLGKAPRALPSLLIYISGFALTTTPGKAGEIYRSLPLKKHGVPYSTSIAAFLSERLSDLIAVVLLAMMALSKANNYQILVWVSIVMVLVAVAATSQFSYWEKHISHLLSWSHRLTQSWQKFSLVMHAAEICHQPRIMLPTLLLSMIAWGAEAVAFYWILLWLDVESSLAIATMIYAVSMLAGALSFMPGGLGGAEAAMIALLTWTGCPLSVALAATIIIRFATLWFAVILGLLALAIRTGDTP